MNEDREYNDARDAEIERGRICTDCACPIDKPKSDEPGQCDECCYAEMTES